MRERSTTRRLSSGPAIHPPPSNGAVTIPGGRHPFNAEPREGTPSRSRGLVRRSLIGAARLAPSGDHDYPSADQPMTWVTTDQGFSEVFTPAGGPRPHYDSLVASIESFTRNEIERRERLQTLALVSQGVTFTVYGEKEGLERIFPFEFIPRII